MKFVGAGVDSILNQPVHSVHRQKPVLSTRRLHSVDYFDSVDPTISVDFDFETGDETRREISRDERRAETGDETRRETRRDGRLFVYWTFSPTKNLRICVSISTTDVGVEPGTSAVTGGCSNN